MPKNAFQIKLEQLPRLREEFGEDYMDKLFVKLILLTEEIDIQMDGVACPESAAAILNAFRSIHNEIAV